MRHSQTAWSPVDEPTPLPFSSPMVVVKRALLDGLGDVVCADRVGSGKVGDRQRHIEDPIEGAVGND